MKPIRTPASTMVYQLPGGTEDNDLWVCRLTPGEVLSDWMPSAEERRALAAGGRVQLMVAMEPIPPVMIGVIAPWCVKAGHDPKLMVLGRDYLGRRSYACPECDAAPERIGQ